MRVLNILVNGYTKIKLTKKEHNILYPARKRSWSCNYTLYIDELESGNLKTKIVRHTTLKAKLLVTTITPFLILWEGMRNTGEVFADIKDLWKETKHNGSSYEVNYIEPTYKSYDKLKRLYEANKRT